MTSPPELFWRVFETTGAIWAYLAYRRWMSLAKFGMMISLN